MARCSMTGRWTCPVLADVLGAEALRQHEIDLQGAALPVAADGVPQHEFELGTVKGALARVQGVFEARGLDRRLQRAFGLVPGRVAARPASPDGPRT